MDTPVYKFQKLLRELFQFDCADLDFGIYRIMNYRRGVIEKFITQDLPGAVSEELDRGALAEQSQAGKELEKLEQQIRGIDAHAIDPDGNLTEAIKKLDIGKKYLALKEKAAGGRGRKAIQAGIFNHLYTFFSRYYQDGDFISKRRYSKRQRYAIPYNGEEVYLYWANHDQYYVKTAEYFHDYTFTSHGVTVHFKLTAANVEQNNVKGEKRFFLPRAKEIAWDEKESQLVIPFEYRPLNEQEEITYGKKNQQDTIIAKALEDIPNILSPKTAAPSLAALTAEKRKTAEGDSVSFLEHHLRQYTRRNTSDFFIHKDLKDFLSRELDFYLKNEVLNLEEMENAGEELARGWFQMMRVLKAVGGRIIDFLDQIEGFQKMLWEKRKFITDTQYCITLGNIQEDFYPEIAACDSQWAEWKELFHINEEEENLFNSGMNKKDKRIAFLNAHPTLVLDTKHFDEHFVDKLLASFDDLDEMTDGLLIHSENFQALSLLLEKYRERVKCIYIDPPYNTGNDEFIYKDTYQHASWLSMMWDRLFSGRQLLGPRGLLWCTLDDHEKDNMCEIGKAVFGVPNLFPIVVWQHSIQGKGYTGSVSVGHNYVLIFGKLPSSAVGVLERTEEHNVNYSNPDKDPKGPWRSGDVRNALYRPNLIYDIHTPSGKTIKPPDKGWRWSWETIKKKIASGEIVFSKDERKIIRKIYLKDQGGRVPESIWMSKEVGSTRTANGQLKSLFGVSPEYTTPKPTGLVERMLNISEGKYGIVLDYFAGSGTTGHAVINLNRENGGRRRFILVEMGGYFDSILVPRIKKVTFTPEWKDGKPRRMATQEEAERSPRIVKYMRVESYEDALNNIAFDEPSGQQALEFDDYLIKYMLKWETRASETLLNVEKLARPFSYKLHIHADLLAATSAQAGGQTRDKVADIAETFNYLLGLQVRTRKVYFNQDQRYLVYRGRIDLPASAGQAGHRRIVVIWRETEGWQKADLERDKKFVAEQKFTEDADEVFVNGDSFIPNAKALEPVFKGRMFAPVES